MYEEPNFCTPLIQNKQLVETCKKAKLTEGIGLCNIAKFQELQFKKNIELKYDDCNVHFIENKLEKLE